MKYKPDKRVGIKAYLNSSKAEIPCLKYFFNIDCPIGLGAFAITVNPPPVTAPATTAYFMLADKFGTRLLR